MIHTTCEVSKMTTAISVEGLVKRFGRQIGSRRARPDGAGRRGPRLPRTERRRQDHHAPRSCSDCCARTPARRRCSGMDPWRDAAAPAPPAGVRARRREPVAEPHRRRGDRPARRPCAAAWTRAPRRAHRALPARPDQEVPRLLQGQPPEGGAGGSVRRRRRALPAGRADVRPGPADDGRLPGRASARPTPPAATVLLSSHILSEVEALCDRLTIVRAGRTADTGTFEELRHLTRTTVVVETAAPLDPAARTCPACTTRPSTPRTPSSRWTTPT